MDKKSNYRICKFCKHSSADWCICAGYLGINQTVYSRYETGRNDMKPFQIIALCEYYKVSADYVLGLPEGRPYGLSKTKGGKP